MSFNWSALREKPSLKCGNINTKGSILFLASPAFSAWTAGLDGGGDVFQSEPANIEVGGHNYTFMAYQRRIVRGRGTLTKQLVCFRKKTANLGLGEHKAVNTAGKTVSSDGEQCCVAKSSRPLGGEWPEQTIETKLF